jgi:signal transduction histidine kinase
MLPSRSLASGFVSPDVLAVPPAGMVRSPAMIRQDDTTAKLQRAKERLYVLCQAGGWGGFFLLQVISLRIFSPVKPGLTTMDLVFGILRIVTIGWLITHYVRPLLTRLGWKELGWRPLLPRILAAGFAMGFVWCIAGFGIDLVILRYPWNHNYSIAAGFVAVWMNASFGAIGWLCLYFFYHLLERLNRLQVEQLRLVANVKEAELRALKSQVNPHFLFNSLNSLRALIDEDAPRARESVTRLANMLRYSLQSGQLETVPFEDELRIVEDYLALEQIRHEDRLRVRWDVAEATRACCLPPMLLQTLVENAVKYGISPRREGGELVISARLDRGGLCLRVTNPGELGAPASAAAARAGSSTGVGLRNASERLKLLFGERAWLNLLAEPPGCVTAEVHIPLKPAPAA